MNKNRVFRESAALSVRRPKPGTGPVTGPRIGGMGDKRQRRVWEQRGYETAGYPKRGWYGERHEHAPVYAG